MLQSVTSLIRLIRWAIVTAVTQGFALLVLSWILPGFAIHGLATPLVAGVIISTLLAASWAAIHRLAVKLQPILFPIAMFALTGLIIWLGAIIVNSIQPHTLRLHNIGTGIMVAVGLTLITTIIGAFFSLNDDASYDRFVTRPLRAQFASSPTTAKRGVVFIEIDGLAEPVLHQAIARGYAPTLKRWLESGSHLVRTWEPDLSSQTSASQAGILLGRNDDIPAFRWWDKTRGQLMVSSRMQTARALEEQLSTGDGLLVGGGSRWNVFSGDAEDCIGVFSKLGSNDVGHSSYLAYFSNPYLLARTFGLFFADIVRERYQAWRQVRDHVQPRIHRTFKYAFVRAGSTTFLQEASLFMLQADVFRGVPAVYCTFFGYDEVAHHSGIDRPDALKVLRTIDRVIARVEHAAETANRPYNLVVLSDHGQSQGATFRQRYGETLADLVERLLVDERHVARLPHIQEHAEHIGAALDEAVAGGNGPVRFARRARVRRDASRLDGFDDGPPDIGGQGVDNDTSDVIVLASGNLGLVSFPDWPERLTREEIDERFPGFLDGLRRHEGISFVLVRSAVDGTVVLGSNGTRFLDDGDRVDGDNPLAGFGPRAADHLRRSDRFRNAPDIMVMSMFDPETGEVAAFEELVGTHGGLGGTQTEPFVLYPVTFPLDHDRPIVGAPDLHDRLKEAMSRLQLVSDETPTLIADGSVRTAQPVADLRGRT